MNDNIYTSSNYGKCVTIIAPGVDIMSIWPLHGSKAVIGFFRGSKPDSGTSMAAPHVSGAIALAIAEGTFTTVSQVHDYMVKISIKVLPDLTTG
jgi:subtilisin family serine protease